MSTVLGGNSEAGFGHPDSPHIQDGRRRRRNRVKSDTRRARNNARAAAHQAARASLPPAASPTRTAFSPLPQQPASPSQVFPPPSNSPAKNHILVFSGQPANNFCFILQHHHHGRVQQGRSTTAKEKSLKCFWSTVCPPGLLPVKH